ncbi:MAG: Gfo/Idh/MocA family oxidoreductase [Acidobacteriota bacterium]|nr:Gfo/Idh/MocA family oxidoreductase [Acidobacteriota bacterium]
MGDKLRIGIVGTGYIAQALAPAMGESPEAELVAVASRSVGRAEQFITEHGTGGQGAVKAFGSWREMIAWDGLDAVYVATPTSTREEIAVAAAEAGQHVLAEKPFDGLESLQRITTACREHGVAFLDATHFVHHPRTAQIKSEAEQRIGEPLALRTAFFFPNPDRTNIRFDPRLEPTGALGDMAWYCMRAAVEYLPGSFEVESLQTSLSRDLETGAVVRVSGSMLFGDGTTTTYDAGYDVGALVQDLDLLGTEGVIHLEDFVQDWKQGAGFDHPDHVVGFTQRRALAPPAEFAFVPTPSQRTAHSLMIDAFASLARHPDRQDLQEASIRASERTQGLLDAAWRAGGG